MFYSLAAKICEMFLLPFEDKIYIFVPLFDCHVLYVTHMLTDI